MQLWIYVGDHVYKREKVGVNKEIIGRNEVVHTIFPMCSNTSHCYVFYLCKSFTSIIKCSVFSTSQARVLHFNWCICWRVTPGQEGNLLRQYNYCRVVKIGIFLQFSTVQPSISILQKMTCSIIIYQFENMISSSCSFSFFPLATSLS